MNNDAIDALGGADVRKTYLTIGAEGTFRMQVPEGTKDAKTRTYEVDGVEKSKTEIHKAVLKPVLLKNLSFFDGDYGQNIILDVDINGTDFSIQVKTSSGYGTALMERLPHLDLTKPFELRGYNFEDDNGKNRKGISVSQDGEKLNSFFKSGEGKDTELLHGYPEVDQEKKPSPSETTKWKKFWASYFSEIEDFLVDYIKENVVVPQAEEEDAIESLDQEF